MCGSLNISKVVVGCSTIQHGGPLGATIQRLGESIATLFKKETLNPEPNLEIKLKNWTPGNLAHKEILKFVLVEAALEYIFSFK